MPNESRDLGRGAGGGERSNHHVVPRGAARGGRPGAELGGVCEDSVGGGVRRCKVLAAADARGDCWGGRRAIELSGGAASYAFRSGSVGRGGAPLVVGSGGRRRPLVIPIRLSGGFFYPV
jgi:hypothetical protein